MSYSGKEAIECCEDLRRNVPALLNEDGGGGRNGGILIEAVYNKMHNNTTN